MTNKKEKIRDKIIKLMKTNLDSMERTYPLTELEKHVKIEFFEYRRNIDPLNISSKLKLPATEVLKYIEVFHTNTDVKDSVVMLVNIKQLLEEEFERIISKYILETYNELENH